MNMNMAWHKTILLRYHPAMPGLTYLQAFTDDHVFDAMVRALESLRQKNEKPTINEVTGGFDWRSIARESVLTLVEDLDRSSQDLKDLGNQMPGITPDGDHVKLMSAAWRIVSLGLAFPTFENNKLISLRLTEKGAAAMTLPDNLSRAGYIDRLQVGNPKIKKEIFEHLTDADDCLRANLPRAAAVMCGVAAEVTTVEAYIAMGKLSLVSGKHIQFKDQLSEVISQSGNIAGLPADSRYRLTVALAALESARTARNQSAHAGGTRPDIVAVRECLVSMCVQIPVVWDLVIIPNLPP